MAQHPGKIAFGNSIREKLIGIHSTAGMRREDELNMSGVDEEDDEEEEEPPQAPPPVSLKKRFLNVFAQPLSVPVNFVAPVHVKTAEQRKFIEAALQEHFIFASLQEKELQSLVNAMETHEVKDAGTRIIKQGDIGDYFYICQRGSIEFFVDGKSVGTAGAGASFGELALLYNCPRAATCVAKEASTLLWKVDQRTFRQILASHKMQNNEELRQLVQGVPFLADLDDAYISKIVSALTHVSFKKGQYIIEKGRTGTVFYIVQKGTVRVTSISVGNSSYKDQTLGPGESFGERAILMDEPRSANVICESDEVQALALSREVFVKVLGDYSDLIIKSQDKRLLTSMPLFADAGLESNEIDALMANMEEMTFPAGHVISVEGEPTLPALYIIHSGSVSTRTKKEPQEEVVTTGGFFGLDYLRPEAGEASSQYTEEDIMINGFMTVTVAEDARLGVLTRAAVKSALGDVFAKKLSASLTGQKKTLQLEDLIKHRILGVGTFGKVWLVSVASDSSPCAAGGDKPQPYALKIQKKKELIQHHQVAGVMREKAVMSRLKHPFIIQLMATFQDSAHLYMLLTLIQGGELFSIIHRKDSKGDAERGLPETHARFYGAAILEALSYMHRRRILYRDLKPENVLLGGDGYPVLVDLGFAKVVLDKTYTLCGTPLYIAPEVILNRGHDKGADHWSLAVLIFEMITGDTPFYESNIDQMELFQRIASGKYKMPSSGMSSNAKDLVKRVLVVKPTERLGSFARGAKDIRDHEWFAIMDWRRLIKKDLPAPWKPDVKDPFDCSHFENWEHLERSETKKKNRREVPLSSKEQAKFEGF